MENTCNKGVPVSRNIHALANRLNTPAMTTISFEKSADRAPMESWPLLSHEIFCQEKDWQSYATAKFTPNWKIGDYPIK